MLRTKEYEKTRIIVDESNMNSNDDNKRMYKDVVRERLNINFTMLSL